MRRAFPLLVSFALAAGAAAQTPPSEAQIRADVRANIASNATVTLRGNGSRQLNGGVYEFVHSITARYPYEGVPGVEVEGYHDVVYQSHGSRYVFDRVRVGDWKYFGIPAPSVEEIQAIVDTDDVTPYTNEGDVMMLDRSITVEETETPTKPNQATAHGTARYKVWVSDGWVQDMTADVEVTAFRESLGDPWTSFRTQFSNKTEGDRSPMPQGALRMWQYEQMQDQVAESSDLPEVSVPEFSSKEGLVRFAYRMLRETTDPKTIEAYLRALAPNSYFADEERRAFAPGVSIGRGPEDMFRFGSSFAEVTCETPTYFEEDGIVFFQSILDIQEPNETRYALKMGVEQEDVGYRNGQQVWGDWAVTFIVPQFGMSDDDLAWIRSFEDPERLWAASGQATQAATREAEAARDGAADRARGAVEGAVEEGRRRLGRIFRRGGN